MKIKFKFYLTVFIILSLFVPLLSCNNSPEQDTVKNTAATIENIAQTTQEHDIYKMVIPETDYNGKEFRILNQSTGSYYYQLSAEEQNGEILNDAIYKRNLEMESYLNIKINEILVDNRDTHLSTAKKAILAGDDVYDLIMTDDRNSWSLATTGLAIPYNNIPTIDLNQKWWSQTINQDISILGKLYFSLGDFNLTSYSAVNVLMYDHKIAKDYQIDNLYELVRSGKWTLDKLYELIAKTTRDINGDGVMDVDDQYGITSHYKQMLPCFWIGSGMRSIIKNDSDEPVFNLNGNEKFASFYMRFLDTMHNDNVWFDSSVLDDYADNTLFKDDRALFLVSRVHFIMRFFRGMPGDFGIIPFPKYDEGQDKYYSRTEGGLLPVVPITAEENKEFIGTIMECMSAYSHEYILPVYYETLLKDKFARDADSFEMLDIIFNNRVYDLGDTIWTEQVRDGVFADMFKKNNRNLTSKLSSMENSVNTQIDKSLKLFQELD